MIAQKKNEIADVCLVLEGTYPYVKGGVSEWVDQLVSGMPELTFSLFFIGSRREAYGELKRKLPSNVIDLRETFLMDDAPDPRVRLSRRATHGFCERMVRLYEQSNAQNQTQAFWKVLDFIDEHWEKVPFKTLCRTKTAWKNLVSVYEKVAGEQSFIDFFWTFYFTHIPTFRLLNARHDVPDARLYHSVSTGYAGLIGGVVARTRRRPFLITEHGIYVKERITEISKSESIYELVPEYFTTDSGLGVLKETWIQLFHFLGNISYQAADEVITLSEVNARLQREFGAPSEKLRIIPNGIELAGYESAFKRRQGRGRAKEQPLIVGFLGRIVPIKDIRTLIRAAKLLMQSHPNVEFHLAGPADEDDEYYLECKNFVEQLGLSHKVRFLGNQKAVEFLESIDVLVLTSISEGLPLVILEAFAAGVPVVSTDVGACRELIFGRTPGDKQIGRAGVLTRIGSPEDTANALAALVDNPTRMDEMGRVGRARVEQHYLLKDIVGQYRRMYVGYAGGAGATEAAHPGNSSPPMAVKTH